MAGCRILLCDDDREMREWLRGVIEAEGAEATLAGSGSELLGLLFSGRPFDLVISDVRMPPPDGLRALELARAAGHDVPFLLVTAFGDDSLHADAAAIPAAAILDKPFTARELVGAARALLAPGWRRSSPPPRSDR